MSLIKYYNIESKYWNRKMRQSNCSCYLTSKPAAMIFNTSVELWSYITLIAQVQVFKYFIEHQLLNTP